MHPIGVAPTDIKKANAIFIGHAHFDHMSDAAAVAKQTGRAGDRRIVRERGADEGRRAGEAVQGGQGRRGACSIPGVTVEAVLGHHNVIATTVPEGFLDKQAAALEAASLQKPLTDAEKQQTRRDSRARQPRSEDRDRRRDQLPLHLRQRVPPAVRRQPGTDHRRPARRSRRRRRPSTSRCFRTSSSRQGFRRCSIW